MFLLVASLHGQLHDTYRRAVQDHCNDPAELVGVDRLPRHYVASLTARALFVPGRNCRLCRHRSEEHTSELQSLMRNSYDGFCLKKKKHTNYDQTQNHHRSLLYRVDKETT